jgi:hypothetical protein
MIAIVRGGWLPVVAALWLAGCGDGATDADAVPSEGAAASASPPDPEDIDLRDYFPLDPGTTWVYDLKSPEFRQYQWDLVWPAENEQSFRKTYSGTMSGGNAEITYTVVGPVPPPSRPGILQYDECVQVTIGNDSALLYMLAETDATGLPHLIQPAQVLWGINEPFQVDEVLLYEGEATPDGALPGTQPHQIRNLLCSPTLGSVQYLPAEVRLATAPIDMAVPGYEGQPCLHFVRKFGTEEYVTHTEDLWYAKGKGLVRLVQTVEGKTTLEQTLREMRNH